MFVPFSPGNFRISRVIREKIAGKHPDCHGPGCYFCYRPRDIYNNGLISPSTRLLSVVERATEHLLDSRLKRAAFDGPTTIFPAVPKSERSSGKRGSISPFAFLQFSEYSKEETGGKITPTLRLASNPG